MKMKLNALKACFLNYTIIIQCFVFSISGGGSEASYKETEKTSAMTTTHTLLKLQSHHRRFV